MLKGKKILVTGSSRGIGKEIVKTFLGNGATVWGLCSKPSASRIFKASSPTGKSLKGFSTSTISLIHSYLSSGSVNLVLSVFLESPILPIA